MEQSTTLNNKKQRNSSVELLRIIAIVMIVMSHSSVHGMFPEEPSAIAFNNIFLDWFVLGNLGVDIFVLISGYFLCEKSATIKSLPRLMAQVWFYSILCLIVFLAIKRTVSAGELITAIFPTIFVEYWFFTAYIVLLLLTPLINIVLNKASRKQLSVGLVVMVILWVIIPTFTLQDMYGTQVLQFIMMYCIGAYFKKYPDNLFEIKAARNTITIIAFLLMFTSSIVIRFLSGYISLFDGMENLFYSRTSVLTVCCAVGLLAGAIYRKPYTSKAINTIGGCCFGVYLIHDNPFIRQLLWGEWIPNYLYYDSGILILRMIISVIIVFCIGTLIEWLRKKIIEKPTVRFVEMIFEKIYNLAGRIAYRLRCGIEQHLNKIK